MFDSIRRTLPLILCIVPVAIAACGRGDAEVEASTPATEAALGANEVVIHARDFAFDAPDTIQSGPTTFRLVNEGPDLHHVQLVRLEGGHSFDDLMKYMAANGQPPAWSVEVGGPNTPNPGAESNGSLDLKPGEYALLCVIPAPDGQPHVMKGMSKPLTVVPATGPARAMPEADVVMTLDDYSFAAAPEIRAGQRTIRVENRAAQPHEVLFAKLAPGKTAADLLGWITKPQGPPPADLLGGTTAFRAGESNTVSIDFQPGEYALLCFIPDAGDGQPHVAHGMVRQITVQ